MKYFKYGIGLLLIAIGVLFLNVHLPTKVAATPITDFIGHSVLIVLGLILILLAYTKYRATLIALFGVFVIEMGLDLLAESIEKKNMDIPSDIVLFIVWFGFGILVLFYSHQIHHKRKIQNEKT